MLPEVEPPKRFIEKYDDDITEVWWGYVRCGYYNKQYMHRHYKYGPAYTRIDLDGTIILEMYYQDNTLHRTDGPALIEYIDGVAFSFGYYLFGEEISKEEFKTPGFIDAFILENS